MKDIMFSYSRRASNYRQSRLWGTAGPLVDASVLAGKATPRPSVCPQCGPGYGDFVTHVLILKDTGILDPLRIAYKYERQVEAGLVLILQKPLGWRSLPLWHNNRCAALLLLSLLCMQLSSALCVTVHRVVFKVCEHSPHQSQPWALDLVR